MPDDSTVTINENKTSAPKDERIGLVRGDRLCQQCAYNLTGQPVVRERHYEMLIVRCPECGTVASIQQQPVLAQWLGKLNGLWLAVWLLVVLALGVGGTAGLAGFGFGVATRAAYDSREPIETFYESTLDPNAAQNAGNSTSSRTLDFDKWWSQQNIAEVRNKLGGFRSLVDWPILFTFIVPLALMAAFLGIFWASILIHWSRKRLLVWWLVCAALLLLWTTLFANTIQPGQYSIVSTWDAAMLVVGVPIAWINLIFCAAMLLVFLLIGRSVMRVLVRFLLPPRMQASLGALWRTDGLEPPGLA